MSDARTEDLATADVRADPRASTAADDRARPYPPSVVDRYLAWAERLPVGLITLYSAVFVAIAILANVVTWIGDPDAVGTIDVYRTSLGFYLVFPLALMHFLNAVARDALARFHPAMDIDDDRYARFEYELTTLPASTTWIVIALSLAFTVAFAWFTPSFTDAIGSAPWVAAFDALLYSLVWVSIGAFLYHSYRQLRTVSHIHEAATHIDLFQPAPLYSFSWLTARTGMGLMILNAYSILTDPATFVNPALFGLVVFAWIIAGAAFVLPLQGMHRRLEAEKQSLLARANAQLGAAIPKLFDPAAPVSTTEAERLGSLLPSLITTRDVISRLPTWPWDSGVVVRFVTTALLPLAAAALSASAAWLQ
jgi:hypothetical protein